MSKNFKLFSVIVFAAVIVFFGACGDGDGVSGGVTVSLGEDSLTLSGPVFYYETIYTQNSNRKYSRFKGSFDVYAYFENSWSPSPSIEGAINAGIFNFEIGIPDDNYLSNIENINNNYFWSNIFGNFGEITTSNTEPVKYAIIRNFYEIGNGNGNLILEKFSETSKSETKERVYFFFVDETVNITGKGKSGNDYGNPYDYKPFNITLAKGWNTVCIRDLYSWSNNNNSTTGSIFLVNPSSFRWTLDSY